MTLFTRVFCVFWLAAVEGELYPLSLQGKCTHCRVHAVWTISITYISYLRKNELYRNFSSCGLSCGIRRSTATVMDKCAGTFAGLLRTSPILNP